MQALACLAALAEAVRDKAPALAESKRAAVLTELLKGAEEVYGTLAPLREADAEVRAHAELLIGRVVFYCAAPGENGVERAEKHLSRAVKLAPGNATAWAALAEVLYEQKKDLAAAETCAREAARLQASSENLCLLSSLVRNTTGGKTEETAGAAAVEAAKAACSADPKDFQAWQRLGTANLWLFMHCSSKELEVLTTAIKAFAHASKLASAVPAPTLESICLKAKERLSSSFSASKDAGAAEKAGETALASAKKAVEAAGIVFDCIFDLHYNYAALLSLSLDFREAIAENLACIARSPAASSRLSYAITGMQSHVRETERMIKEHREPPAGSDRAKRVAELARLCAAPAPVTVPVGGRKLVPFSALAEGKNDGVYLQCRVLGPLKPMLDQPPHQALVVDSEGSVFVLGLHHLPGEYAFEFQRCAFPLRILDPLKKTVHNYSGAGQQQQQQQGGGGGGETAPHSFPCILPCSWEHLLINDLPRRVGKGKAGQFLGRMSVSSAASTVPLPPAAMSAAVAAAGAAGATMASS